MSVSSFNSSMYDVAPIVRRWAGECSMFNVEKQTPNVQRPMSNDQRVWRQVSPSTIVSTSTMPWSLSIALLDTPILPGSLVQAIKITNNDVHTTLKIHFMILMIERRWRFCLRGEKRVYEMGRFVDQRKEYGYWNFRLLNQTPNLALLVIEIPASSK